MYTMSVYACNKLILSYHVLSFLCTLFIHVNIIPLPQKIHLIRTEYYLEHNTMNMRVTTP